MGYIGSRDFTYDAEAIIRRLGQCAHNGRERKNSWKIAYLSRLIALEGFPDPLPLLVGERLVTDRVYMRSQWQCAAVDQWFEGRTPPGATAQADVAALREGSRAMDARAAELGLQLIHGGRA